VKAANTNSAPMRVPMAVIVMARKTLLMRGNARIAVSFERRFTCPPLSHFPNIRHRPTIGFAQSASNGCWHPQSLGRLSLCDPNLQSLPSSSRHCSAQRSLRLLKPKPRPARPVREPSVPELHPARKRNMKKGRRQGRARVTGPTKAARRIHRTKTTLVPGPVPWLLHR
jgi:hypothetical protein